jgi:hypothetical protein
MVDLAPVTQDQPAPTVPPLVDVEPAASSSADEAAASASAAAAAARKAPRAAPKGKAGRSSHADPNAVINPFE